MQTLCSVHKPPNTRHSNCMQQQQQLGRLTLWASACASSKGIHACAEVATGILPAPVASGCAVVLLQAAREAHLRLRRLIKACVVQPFLEPSSVLIWTLTLIYGGLAGYGDKGSTSFSRCGQEV